MFNKKTVRDISIKNKRVLMRADYNVPLDRSHILDDYRLRASLPSIRYILDQKPNGLVIVSHLGRPKGPDDKQFSLAPVAKRLSELLGRKVFFVSDCVGPTARLACEQLPPSGVLLLENLRFHQEEEADSTDFAKALAEVSQADIFVQDGFGVVHRKHASTDAITKLMPAVAGLLLEREIETIERVMTSPDRPLTAVIGGAKISDKIDVLSKFIDMADCVVVGGALANDFLHAEGVKIGDSLVDKEAFKLARDVLAKARKYEKERNFKFMVPVDGVVSRSADGRSSTRLVDFGAHALADIEAYPKKPKSSAYSLKAGEKILDIGPVSASRAAGAIDMSRTVVWAGTMGVAEAKPLTGAESPFGHGSCLVAEAIIGSSNHHANKAFSLVGGGDTVSYIESKGWVDDFSHVSTGGSASLELMAGHHLPGIDALENK